MRPTPNPAGRPSRGERNGFVRRLPMRHVHKSVLVAHPPQQMFALVDAIEEYPKFLPWCGGARVLQRDAKSVEAELEIAYRGIRQSFVTRNVNKPPERIDMMFVRGPFRRLVGHWFFIRVGSLGCRIEFKLDYEFASGVLETLVGGVFDDIAETMVDAFVRRADVVYP